MKIQRIVQLTPPRVSQEYIKEKVVCIRAHRERIFNTSYENTSIKHIFHNYGQSGAGWTFLFGCANESIRQFEQLIAENSIFKNHPIAIIGAGCYGLLTAIQLARAGHRVQIYAKEINDIPSYKAAGFFFPRARKLSTEQERAIFAARAIESFKEYQKIINGTHPFINQGAKLLPAYYGVAIDPGFAPYIKEGLMPYPEEVIINFANGKNYQAHEYKTLFINSGALMAELHRNITELGITILKREIVSFEDINESIIFNCASLGAKSLAKDHRIIPVQGHLITLKDQPKELMQYMINFKVVQYNHLGNPRDELIYYAPKDEGILGITFIRGQDSLTANQHEFDRLLQRCYDFFGV